MSDLERSEYMWITLQKAAYNIADFAVNGRALVEITKSIYGLPQAALLAKLRLDAHLAANIPVGQSCLP